MGFTESLNTKLQTADAEVSEFLAALKAEIRKLHKENIKLQAQHVSDQERIAELEKELKEMAARPTVVVRHFDTPDDEK